MGGKLSILENRTYYSIELRIWVQPARPDKFEKIIRIKPVGSIRVKAKQDLLDFDKVLVMVYANGVWTGNYITSPLDDLREKSSATETSTVVSLFEAKEHSTFADSSSSLSPS